MRNLTQHIVSLVVQPHLQGREIDSNVSSCGGVRYGTAEGSGGSKTTIYSTLARIDLLFSNKAGFGSTLYMPN